MWDRFGRRARLFEQPDQSTLPAIAVDVALREILDAEGVDFSAAGRRSRTPDR
jgi:hypothetical protein